MERKPIVRAPQIQDLYTTFSRNPSFKLEEIKESINSLQEKVNAFIEQNKKFIVFEEISENGGKQLSLNDILQLGKKAGTLPSSGVLLFTNKTKYHQLLKDTSFNGHPISEIFPISEIKISRNDKLTLVNQQKTNSTPIIYYCSSEYYAGWEAILEELELIHVNTIVLDDFDNILKKESRTEFHYFKRIRK